MFLRDLTVESTATYLMGSWGGAVVRAFASRQCVPGSIPGPGVIWTSYVPSYVHRGQTSEHAREITRGSRGSHRERWKWSMIIAINFKFKQSFLSNFCGLDKSTIPPIYLHLLTTLYQLSWAAVHNTFPVGVLASFIHLPVVTLSDNDSKQIAAATSFRMSALLTLRTFLVKVKKI